MGILSLHSDLVNVIIDDPVSIEVASQVCRQLRTALERKRGCLRAVERLERYPEIKLEHSRNDETGYRIALIIEIVRAGYNSLLQWFIDRIEDNTSFSSAWCIAHAAVLCGNNAALKIIRSHISPYAGYGLALKACDVGNLPAVQYLHAEQLLWGNDMLLVAEACGSRNCVNILQYCVDMGADVSPIVLARKAAQHGSIAVLKWMYSRGDLHELHLGTTVSDVLSDCVIADRNLRECVAFAARIGALNSDEFCFKALQRGKMELLDYLRGPEVNAPWSQRCQAYPMQILHGADNFVE